MKKLYYLLFTFLITALSFGQPVINEVDADTPGTDAAEFIEILWTPNTALDGYVVVLYNGSADTSYAAYDLDGFSTDANGFFIIGNPGVSPDITFADNFLQNGADAVALYLNDAATFPNGTAITATNLVSGVVYDTDDADDTGLLAVIGGVQYNENENLAKDTESIQRKSDGTYETKTPTFRASNDAAVCELSLTTTSKTCDAFSVGTDTYTATVNFSGGGTSTYSVMADTGVVDLSAGDPDIDATGTITITGISEGTDVTVTVTGGGGLCNLMSTITSPTCEPSDPLPLYENFDYGGSSGSLITVSGGNWTTHSGTANQVSYTTSSLSMASYPSSGIGGSVTIIGSNSEDVNRAFTTQISGVVYMSALVNISAVTTGNYFMHLKDDGNNFMARVSAKDDGTGKILFGIAASSTLVYGTTPFDLNTTYLVVASYNIDNGASNLYVLSSPPATEPLTPEATDSGTSGIPISSVALRQSGSIPTATIDGIQIGTTWSSAVLSTKTNKIDGFAMYPNPTSLGYVNISSKSQTAMKVGVYDILGKQVINQTVTNNRLEVSNLTTGIYIMKISQDDATTTKKLVIK